jgi:Methyltransferase domain
MISNLLTGRLRTIANFVPQYCVLADIGCDHGLLSVGLSEHCSKVWAIDVSPLAIQGNSQRQYSKLLHYFHHSSETRIHVASPCSINESGARELVANSSASRSVSVIVGNGLTPLLSNNWKCDAIVTAGMGTNRLLQILCNGPTTELYGEIEELFGRIDSDSNPVYYDYVRPRVLDLSHLDLLGVKRIITQPWPPNILPVHALHSALLDNGWQFEDQGIDVTSNHHLTTCFTRSQQVLHYIVISIVCSVLNSNASIVNREKIYRYNH